MEYGKVQRGLLGIQITDINAAIAEDLKLKTNQGVLVNRVNKGSAAEASGIVIGDVIIGIQDHPITSVSELQEWVARNRPGKEIKVTYIRQGERYQVQARLRNNEGNEEVEKVNVAYTFRGVEVEDVPYKELNELALEGGVRIKELVADHWKESGIKEGFIIAFVDKVPVDNVEDLNRILDYKRGGILLEGYYANGQKGTYGIDW